MTDHKYLRILESTTISLEIWKLSQNNKFLLCHAVKSSSPDQIRIAFSTKLKIKFPDLNKVKRDDRLKNLCRRMNISKHTVNYTIWEFSTKVF